MDDATQKGGVELDKLSDEDLCSTIRRCHRAADDLANAARSAIKMAVEEVLCAGRALLEARNRCARGSWGDWQKRNLPDIHPATVSRYLAVAERISHVRNLEEIESVRQLYIACGIIKEPQPKSASNAKSGEGPAVFTAADFTGRVQSLRVFLTQTLLHIPLHGFDPIQAGELSVEISKLFKVFTTLQERLTSVAQPPANLENTALIGTGVKGPKNPNRGQRSGTSPMSGGTTKRGPKRDSADAKKGTAIHGPAGTEKPAGGI